MTSTNTFTTSKEWVMQHLRVGQYAPLVRKHLAAVLVGAGIATLLFLTVTWVRSDSKVTIWLPLILTGNFVRFVVCKSIPLFSDYTSRMLL